MMLNKKFLLLILPIWVTGKENQHQHIYIPSWNDLDERPLPEWYDRAKVGIFVHWGIYSVPAFGNSYSEWFWKSWTDGKTDHVNYIRKYYPKDFKYTHFAKGFTAEFFDTNEWAELFSKSGAKYVVLTSKHHDGYALFPSEPSKDWNSFDLTPHRDIVRELGKAARSQGLMFGVSYSLIEWFHQLYLDDLDTQLQHTSYVDVKMIPEMTLLVEKYRPAILWGDGVWAAKSTYFKSKSFHTWLFNDSPVKDFVVVNDRWGNDSGCTHGSFFNCRDHYNPKVIQEHKFENVFSLDRQSWGFRRNIKLREVMTAKEIIDEVVTTVSCGGNVLINVGATKEGTIIPIFHERLLALGDWLKLNGQSIYSSSPWIHQRDSLNPNVWYTCYRNPYDGHKPIRLPNVDDEITAIFVIFLEWPENNELRIRDIVPYAKKYNTTTMLGESLTMLLLTATFNGVFYIDLPNRAAVHSSHAWTLKFT